MYIGKGRVATCMCHCSIIVAFYMLSMSYPYDRCCTVLYILVGAVRCPWYMLVAPSV